MIIQNNHEKYICKFWNKSWNKEKTTPPINVKIKLQRILNNWYHNVFYYLIYIFSYLFSIYHHYYLPNYHNLPINVWLSQTKYYNQCEIVLFSGLMLQSNFWLILFYLMLIIYTSLSLILLIHKRIYVYSWKCVTLW